MKIQFNAEQEDHDKAVQLQALLKQLSASRQCSASDQDLILELCKQIEAFLSTSEYKSAEHDTDVAELPLKESFGQFIHSILGPSRSELKLSEQRRLLVERAERAEASSFEALAETAEIKQQLDEALEKIRQLENHDD